jgi:hypothetical protein
VEIDEQDLSSAMDLANLEERLVARLGKELTSIRTIYRRDYSTFAMVVRFPFGMLSAVSFYELLIEVTSPFKDGRPIWPFTLEDEMSLLDASERWDVDRVIVNPAKHAAKRTGTVTLRRVPFRRI